MQTHACGSLIQAILHNMKKLKENGTMCTLVGVGRAEWCDSRRMPYLSTCTTAPSFIPPRLCKCVLFHCCVSLHKNSTTSWVRQMFHCRARQLLKWLASIWGPLLQLAATAEPGQSISMKRIGLECKRWRMGRVLLNRTWQQAALLLFPKGRWHTVNGRQ